MNDLERGHHVRQGVLGVRDGVPVGEREADAHGGEAALELGADDVPQREARRADLEADDLEAAGDRLGRRGGVWVPESLCEVAILRDRKSTRLNSSHVKISYAVF